ncbi:hypothetical protein [Saccharospirillum impatiens]|uniref:hypothetical protein n=1 Tax=Saccharospirillum impatiens TaxID=169438 RepID=UPI0003F940C2|nr:hypothetical protein [Saccharospirillum impatiens]
MQAMKTLGLMTLTLLLTVSQVTAESPAGQRFPDVIDVSVRSSADQRFTFQVTLSSPYDTPQRYADAFRVMTPDEATLGVRELLHDHASEQPFTRSLSGVVIPADITRVIVQGRDQQYGYGGKTLTLDLPGR